MVELADLVAEDNNQPQAFVGVATKEFKISFAGIVHHRVAGETLYVDKVLMDYMIFKHAPVQWNAVAGQIIEDEEVKSPDLDPEHLQLLDLQLEIRNHFREEMRLDEEVEQHDIVINPDFVKGE